MDEEHKETAAALVKSVVLLQVKLLLEAARDLALVPVALAAAFVDLMLIKHQEPRFFRGVLRLGEHSEGWIDTWSTGQPPGEPRRENVETLIARVEEVVRDPKVGARRARVLRRWAERQLARAQQRAAGSITARDAAPPADTAPGDAEGRPPP
jgi:hypothetical protein